MIKLRVSYQLYSTMAFHDRLLMGQYPTGRVFEYDREKITDLEGWPPKLQGVSGSAREAQTTVIYGDDVFVGVWPWGELWRYSPDSKSWAFTGRMSSPCKAVAVTADCWLHYLEDICRPGPPTRPAPCICIILGKRSASS